MFPSLKSSARRTSTGRLPLVALRLNDVELSKRIRERVEGVQAQQDQNSTNQKQRDSEGRLAIGFTFDTVLLSDWLSIGDDDNHHVLGETEDSLRGVAGQCRRPCLPAGPREKDLRYLISTPKIDER